MDFKEVCCGLQYLSQDRVLLAVSYEGNNGTWISMKNVVKQLSVS
jgi:hypothetical protein